jgi:hypothetical protein
VETESVPGSSLLAPALCTPKRSTDLLTFVKVPDSTVSALLQEVTELGHELLGPVPCPAGTLLPALLASLRGLTALPPGQVAASHHLASLQMGYELEPQGLVFTEGSVPPLEVWNLSPERPTAPRRRWRRARWCC